MAVLGSTVEALAWRKQQALWHWLRTAVCGTSMGNREISTLCDLLRFPARSNPTRPGGGKPQALHAKILGPSRDLLEQHGRAGMKRAAESDTSQARSAPTPTPIQLARTTSAVRRRPAPPPPALGPLRGSGIRRDLWNSRADPCTRARAAGGVHRDAGSQTRAHKRGGTAPAPLDPCYSRSPCARVWLYSGSDSLQCARPR